MWIYIYIYIYIYILSSTDRLFHPVRNLQCGYTFRMLENRDQNPSNFTLDLVSDCSANKHTTLAKGIFKVLYSNSSSNVRLFTFFIPYRLTRVLNSFDELCIMQAAAENSFASVFNPHGGMYIYCHPPTDCFVLSELFSVARHVGCSKLGSKAVQFYVTLSPRPLGQQADHFSLREFLRYYVATAAATSVCLHFYTLSATRVLNSFEELCIYIYDKRNKERALKSAWCSDGSTGLFFNFSFFIE